jgi:tetratricopeptide (TPR) repeat protein
MPLAPMILVAALAAAQDAPPAGSSSLDAPATAVTRAETTPSGAEGHIAAGLAAFKKKRFSKAQAEFQEAMTADPQSAAAAYYLGYTYYKIAEPTRRNTPNKQKALELFDKAFELDPAFKPAWHASR